MSAHQTWSVKTVEGKLEIHIGDHCAISAFRDRNDGLPMIAARADLLEDVCKVVNSLGKDDWSEGMDPDTAGAVKEARSKLASGEWELWTSCSYLRIVATDVLQTTGMGLEAVADGKGARLMADRDELEALCTIMNNVKLEPQPHVGYAP